jgi:hypothetical protein
MSRLVRARIKAVEFLPEWARCCPEAIEHDQRIGETFADLSRQGTRRGVCRFCGAVRGFHKTVWTQDERNAGVVAIDLLDLDEGIYSEAKSA